LSPFIFSLFFEFLTCFEVLFLSVLLYFSSSCFTLMFQFFIILYFSYFCKFSSSRFALRFDAFVIRRFFSIFRVLDLFRVFVFVGSHFFASFRVLKNGNSLIFNKFLFGFIDNLQFFLSFFA
jgi:hypothetical protein